MELIRENKEIRESGLVISMSVARQVHLRSLAMVSELVAASARFYGNIDNLRSRRMEKPRDRGTSNLHALLP